MSEWISVKDRLPEGDEPFLAFSKFGHMSVVRRRSWGDTYYLVGGLHLLKDIIYWMPLPEPPKEVQG